MKCTKCGCENENGVKFCGVCGQMQEQPVNTQQNTQEQANPYQQQANQQQNPYQQQANQQQNPYQQQANQQPNSFQQEYSNQQQYTYQAQGINTSAISPAPKKSIMPIVLISSAVLVIAAAVIVYVMFFMPKSTQESPISNAYNNLSQSMQIEFDELVEEVPLFSYFSDFDTADSQFDIKVYGPGIDYFLPNGIDLTVQSSIKDQQFKLMYSMLGDSIALLMSNDHITLESDGLLEGAYGISLDTFYEDFQNSYYSALSGMEVPDLSDLSIDPVALQESFNEYTETLLNGFFDNIEYTDPTKEDITINGSTINADKYVVSISDEIIVEILSGLIEDVFADPSLDIYFSSALLESGYTKDEMKEELLSSLEEELSFEELGVEIHVFIYNDRLVRASVADENNAVHMNFNPNGSIFEHISITSELEGYPETTLMTFSMKMDNGVFSMSLQESSSDISITYDTKGTENNLSYSIISFGYEAAAGTMTLTQPSDDKLFMSFSIEDSYYVDIECEKNNLPSGWFDQSTDYTNLLDAGIEELYELLAIFGLA